MSLFACVCICVPQVKNWISFNEPPMVCEGYNAVSEAHSVLPQSKAPHSLQSHCSQQQWTHTHSSKHQDVDGPDGPFCLCVCAPQNKFAPGVNGGRKYYYGCARCG